MSSRLSRHMSLALEVTALVALMPSAGCVASRHAAASREVTTTRPIPPCAIKRTPPVEAQAAQALPTLTRELAHPDAATRRRAARAIGKMGSAAAPAVQALIGVLRDQDRRVTAAATWALGRIGPPAAPASHLLVAKLTWFGVQYVSTKGTILALARIGRGALPELLAGAASPSMEVHRGVIEVLGLLGPQAEGALDALFRLLRLPEGDRAGWALGRITPRKAVPAVSARLLPLLADHLPHVRRRALEALGGLRPSDHASIQAVHGRTGDPDDRVRKEAFLTLGAMSNVTLVGRARLLELANPANPRFRPQVVLGLHRLEVVTPDLLPALGHVINRRPYHEEIEKAALDLAARLAARHRQAMLLLIHTLRDSCSKVRGWSCYGRELLFRLGEMVLHPLVQALPTFPDKREILRLLERFGPKAQVAVPAILGVLASAAHSDFHWDAVNALGAIGPGARAAIPTLLALLRKESAHVHRETLLKALGRIRQVAPSTGSLGPMRPQ